MRQSPKQQTIEYDEIYALVVRLDADLTAGRARFWRASDGELLTRLELVVPAILADDIAPCKAVIPVGPMAEVPR